MNIVNALLLNRVQVQERQQRRRWINATINRRYSRLYWNDHQLKSIRVKLCRWIIGKQFEYFLKTRIPLIYRLSLPFFDIVPMYFPPIELSPDYKLKMMRFLGSLPSLAVLVLSILLLPLIDYRSCFWNASRRYKVVRSMPWENHYVLLSDRLNYVIFFQLVSPLPR